MSAVICYTSPLSRSWDLDDDFGNGKLSIIIPTIFFLVLF